MTGLRVAKMSEDGPVPGLDRRWLLIVVVVSLLVSAAVYVYFIFQPPGP